MTRNRIIRRFEESGEHDFTKMEPMDIAGYYLRQYPGDSLGKLSSDMKEQKIPTTKGKVVEVLLKAVLQMEG